MTLSCRQTRNQMLGHKQQITAAHYRLDLGEDMHTSITLILKLHVNLLTKRNDVYRSRGINHFNLSY